ncbi:MAG: alpha/beta fold hydrolase [Prolixibacteraceae bacterium]|nr:alpha/beta fold hydrolase [Prolixibacteraceae bacterium]
MRKNFLQKGIVALIFIILVSGCDLLNTKKEENTVDTYLVSYEKVKSYTPYIIQVAFNLIPGDYPELTEIKEKAVRGIFIYRITYYTTFNNELKEASGLVCVPIGDEAFPLMSYQNGTNTLHSKAPSVDPDALLFRLLEGVASTGFVVAIPDYLGFGSSEDMFHPYLHKESTVTTVVDMLRATRELALHLNVEMKNELYIAGYSQGGWATMQLQKAIETKYSNEFNLKASACGAGPYDLNYINDYVTGLTNYPMPYFLAYMLNSYKNLGSITTPLNEIVKEPYASKISTLFDGSKSGEEINAELTTKISDLFTDDYITNHATDSKYSSVISTLTGNSIAAWETTIPTLLIHGMEDDFVPRQVSSNLYQDFLAQGVPLDQVTWLPLPGLNHQGGIIPSGLASVKWFLDLKEETP